MSERSLLADLVERFFSDRCTPDDVAEIEAGRDPRPLWDEIEELGLTLAAVPEDLGGGGGSMLDALTVLRAAGRHAVPLPLAETGLLGSFVLERAGLAVPSGPLTFAPVYRGESLHLVQERGGARLRGRATRLPWARFCDHLVALARGKGGALFAAIVESPMPVVADRRNLAGEPRETIELADVALGAGAFAELSLDVDELFLRGALGRAVMMLGALESACDLAVAHAKDRTQFGRSLASFQAVQHMLAQAARDVALTRAAVELAATVAAEDLRGGWLEIASAKVIAGRAAESVSAYAHQVHGAIGVTKEYSLSALTRRLWSWRDEFGTEVEWAQRIGQEAWRSPGGVWGLATSGRLPIELARTA